MVGTKADTEYILTSNRWQISSPRSTHWREASCREVACPQYEFGWKTVLPVNDEANIAFIKRLGLRYRVERNDPLLVTFVFEPGQECFKGRLGQHHTLLERAPFFSVTKMGDRRMLEWDQWIDYMDTDLRKLKG